MKIIFYLFLSLLFLLASCKEELSDNNCCDCEAPMTETGAGTISFDLDGTTWSPCNTNSKNGSSPKVFATRDTNSGWDWIKIKGSKLVNGGSEDIYIQLSWAKVGLIPQSNELYKPHGSISLELFADNSFYKNAIYSSDTLNEFYLEVTKLDSINKIIAGRFGGTFTTKWFGEKDTVIIKNGRFDTHYY